MRNFIKAAVISLKQSADLSGGKNPASVSAVAMQVCDINPFSYLANSRHGEGGFFLATAACFFLRARAREFSNDSFFLIFELVCRRLGVRII